MRFSYVGHKFPGQQKIYRNQYNDHNKHFKLPRKLLHVPYYKFPTFKAPDLLPNLGDLRHH